MGTYAGLMTNHTYFPYKGQKRTYNQAVKAATQALSHISQDETNIQDTINFIGQVAINEQKKEIDSIQNYCKGLSEEFKFNDGTDIAKTLQMTPEEVISDPDKFQNALIVGFDSARRGLEETKKNIEQIYKNAGFIKKGEFGPVPLKSFNDYANTQSLFRLHGDISTLINRLTGRYVKEKINDATMSAKLDTIVAQVLAKQNIAQQIRDGATAAALGVGILQDLSGQFQEALNNDPNMATFETLSEDIMDNITQQYLDAFETQDPTSKFQAMLFKGLDSPQMQQYFRNAIEILNIREDSNEIENNIQELSPLLQNASEENKTKLESALQSMRGTMKSNIPVNQSLYKVHFSVAGSSLSKQGILNELLESIGRGENVRANVATDLITFHFDYSVEQDSTTINNYIRDMSESLSSIGDYLQQNRSNKNIQAFQDKLNEVNHSLTNLANLIEEELNKIDKFKNKKMFIQHESLKMSTTAEKSPNHGFDGRTMVITSYIGYLASMATAKAPINVDELEFLSYNLFPGAAAGTKEAKTTLENYFSVFAGMLMFDDVQNMAHEAIEQMQSLSSNGQVETLHVYNLNTLFVPASVILTKMYNDLQNQFQQTKALGTSNAIKTSISINDNAKSISGIQVSINFLPEFRNMIQQLYQSLA